VRAKETERDRDRDRDREREIERERERGRKRNRWCSQTILHRVLTVSKSIRDSRFDLYDQIPLAAMAGRDGTSKGDG